MKLALAQLNPKVGDIDGNTEKILQAVSHARTSGSDLIILPELALTGYPPRDLVESSHFLSKQNQALTLIHSKLEQMMMIAGCLSRNTSKPGKGLHNSAVLFQRNSPPHFYHKHLLPNYDVFDESRYFEPGERPFAFEVQGKKIGVTICEDIWNVDGFRSVNYALHPLEIYKTNRIDLLINISSSPFSIGKTAARTQLLQDTCEKLGCQIAYCNQVGGNEELLFDGCSQFLDQKGWVRARAKAFQEDLIVVDLNTLDLKLAPWPETAVEWHRDALRMGIKDFFEKNTMRGAIVGLSGGIDSSVVACLAVDALGAKNVLGVLLPSEYTSPESLEDARLLSSNLGMRALECPIDPIRTSIRFGLETTLGTETTDGVLERVRENLQPRVRMTMLMALANQFNFLLLNTSNKSEIATGYSTQYGDTAGALAVIGDLVKSEVYELARNLNQPQCLIPERIFQRAPTAELKPNQTDSDQLPPYPVLDEMVKKVIEEGRDFDSLKEFDSKWVQIFRDLYKASEFKRRQFPPILRVSKKAFGVGRRIPLASKID